MNDRDPDLDPNDVAVFEGQSVWSMGPIVPHEERPIADQLAWLWGFLLLFGIALPLFVLGVVLL